ncbi:hypothetical protein QX776_07425 [Alteromonadaceae bacterium BrNp21-10]|nr:hypothetical protein [Alteromonadaceae bacterium BrNp21-10]
MKVAILEGLGTAILVIVFVKPQSAMKRSVMSTLLLIGAFLLNVYFMSAKCISEYDLHISNGKNVKEAIANNRLSGLPVNEELVAMLKAIESDTKINVDNLIKQFVE